MSLCAHHGDSDLYPAAGGHRTVPKIKTVHACSAGGWVVRGGVVLVLIFWKLHAEVSCPGEVSWDVLLGGGGAAGGRLFPGNSRNSLLRASCSLTIKE